MKYKLVEIGANGMSLEYNRLAQKLYRLRHPERTKQQRKDWQTNNPEKVRENQQRWRNNNPDKVRAIKLRRNEKEKALGLNKVPPTLTTCEYCGAEVVARKGTRFCIPSMGTRCRQKFHEKNHPRKHIKKWMEEKRYYMRTTVNNDNQTQR